MKHLSISLICLVALTAFAACSSKAPVMGVQDGRFAMCTEDDCVSSQATDEHFIEPLKVTGEPDVVMVDLADAVESLIGGKVLHLEGNYLRAEFKSRVLRTMDDAEFLYDQSAGVIHVHATSRGETLDIESNRARIEELRTAFAAMRYPPEILTQKNTAPRRVRSFYILNRQDYFEMASLGQVSMASSTQSAVELGLMTVAFSPSASISKTSGHISTHDSQPMHSS